MGDTREALLAQQAALAVRLAALEGGERGGTAGQHGSAIGDGGGSGVPASGPHFARCGGAHGGRGAGGVGSHRRLLEALQQAVRTPRSRGGRQHRRGARRRRHWRRKRHSSRRQGTRRRQRPRRRRRRRSSCRRQMGRRRQSWRWPRPRRWRRWRSRRRQSSRRRKTRQERAAAARLGRGGLDGADRAGDRAGVAGADRRALRQVARRRCPGGRVRHALAHEEGHARHTARAQHQKVL